MFDAPDPLPIILANAGKAPDKPPMFGETNKPGKKLGRTKSMQPTFLGEDSTPKGGQLGQKTLLGE